MRARDRKLILPDGTEEAGYGFGAKATGIYELVFNTSQAGYQEIVSDLSYADQAVVMTYPLIGNYGMTDEDYECRVLSLGALIVRDYNDAPSNFRYTKTLSEVLEENGVPGISGIDTRKLTRRIRSLGNERVLVTDMDTDLEVGLKMLRESEARRDAVSRVSCRKKWYKRTADAKFNVVVIDCGCKLNIIRSLNAARCNVIVVPYDTDPEEIAFLKPDGIVISNGPGNPEDAGVVIETARALSGRYPMLGICLGHQILALSHGAKTYKLKFGHRGGNHPVREESTGSIFMTAQNHSYAVEEGSLSGTDFSVAFRNLLDDTIEGLCLEKERIFTVQFHPESAPGPNDSRELFRRFTDSM